MQKQKQLSPLESTIAASLAGFTGRIILHPIDTIKARLQVQTVSGSQIMQQQTHLYSNSLDAMRKIYASEGIRGFYRGLGVSLLFTAPAQTVYLTSYDAAKKYFVKATNTGEDNFLIHFASGFAAEAVSCLFWVPHVSDCIVIL